MTMTTTKHMDTEAGAGSQLPVILHVDGWVDYFESRIPVEVNYRELDRYLPAADELETAGCRVGRNDYPALIFDLAVRGLLTFDAALVAVPSAWSACEYPARMYGTEDWEFVRDEVLGGGRVYIKDGKRWPRPRKPKTLWRGAMPEHREGFSWTDDRTLAQWFANRWVTQGQGRVWECQVPPDRLWWYIGDSGRGESEYVADVRGLDIHLTAGQEGAA